MSYAGTNKGGTAAILAAERLADERRQELAVDGIDTDQAIAAFPAALDRIMGEAGLWDEHLAASAFLQAGGDSAEAVHLLRAHRSTLPRLAISEPADAATMQVVRRIVPAHRSPDGPQLLGETVDFTARLLRAPGAPDPLPLTDEPDTTAPTQYADEPFRRYSQFLRDRGLLIERTDPADPEPVDLAMTPPQLPASRAAILSAMALSETGGLINLWYRSVLGPDGYADESVTLGEVRRGRLRIDVRHPHTGNPVAIGEIRVSETEALSHLDERGEDPSQFDAGYGLVLGHNERKAIAMANMDLAATRYGGTPEGQQLQQLLMMTTDGLASNGFLEHLKLPHYVTFRSMMERAEAARAVQDAEQVSVPDAATAEVRDDAPHEATRPKVGQPA